MVERYQSDMVTSITQAEVLIALVVAAHAGVLAVRLCLLWRVACCLCVCNMWRLVCSACATCGDVPRVLCVLRVRAWCVYCVCVVCVWCVGRV